MFGPRAECDAIEPSKSWTTRSTCERGHADFELPARFEHLVVTEAMQPSQQRERTLVEHGRTIGDVRARAVLELQNGPCRRSNA
jgi:hypothetical protein